MWRVIEDEVIPASKELGISQIVWSPIAQGVLSGKYLPGQPLPEGSRAKDDKGGEKMIARYLDEQTLTRVQELKPIADGPGITMAQLAIAWVLANDNITAALVGASRPEQIAENVKASKVTLDADVLVKIDDALGDSVQRDASKSGST